MRKCTYAVCSNAIPKFSPGTRCPECQLAIARAKAAQSSSRYDRREATPGKDKKT